MTQPSFLSDIRAAYQSAFAAHGRTEAAVLYGAGRQEARFTGLTRYLPDGPYSVLDFGCGLGFLAEWVSQNRPKWIYHGVDIVPEFIKSNQSKFSGLPFSVIESPEDIVQKFDFIIVSGVFNLRVAKDLALHQKWVNDTILSLATLARRALSIDFLSTNVDYMLVESYHQDLIGMIKYLSDVYSPRIVYDASYMPYEFAVTSIKDLFA